jgi:hypothetical protein
MNAQWRFVVILLLAIPVSVAAQMTSSNFKVPGDTFAGGGSYGTSTNYHASDTIGEVATPAGEDMASTNYKVCAGFQCVGINKFLSAVVTTSTSPCTPTTPQVAPLSVDLGTLSTSAVSTSADRICVIVSSVSVGNVAVMISSANSALKSIATPSAMIPSVTGTLVAGTAGYGMCDSAATLFTKYSPFNGACDTSTNHVVGHVITTPQQMFGFTGDMQNAVGEILTKAAVSRTTPGRNDYGDLITVIVTGAY